MGDNPTDDPGSGGSGDIAAPVLEISAPARGASLGKVDKVEVKGRVTDTGAGVESVTVNGTPVKVESDGSFVTSVKVTPGVTLIQSKATDKQKNAKIETRAVISGDLQPVDRAVPDGMTMRLDRQLLGTAAQIGAKQLSTMNLDAVVKDANPVFDDGWSCLKARVDVTRVTKGAVTFTLEPVAGGLEIDASVTNLSVGLHVAYDVACSDHTAEVVLSATKFHLSGKVAVMLTNDGNIGLDISQADAEFEGFKWGGDALPSTIQDYFSDTLADALSSMIRTELEGQVSDQIEQRLKPAETTFTVAGQKVIVNLKPTTLRIDEGGVVMALETRVGVPAPAGTLSLRNPAGRPALEKAPGGLGVGISDDALNQMLASMWGAGVIEKNAEIPADALAALGTGANYAKLTLMLPPVVEAQPDGKGLKATVAEAVFALEQRDQPTKPGKQAGRVAVAMRATFTAKLVNDHVVLTTTAPELFIDLITPDDAGKLNEDALRSIGQLFQGRIVAALTDAVGGVPLPAIDGMKVMNGTVTTGDASGGYLIVHGDVAAR